MNSMPHSKMISPRRLDHTLSWRSGYCAQFESLDAQRSDFDVLFVYIPARWGAGFVGAPGEDFDLHDHLKAFCASRRLPLQIVREDEGTFLPMPRKRDRWQLVLRSTRKVEAFPGKLADIDPGNRLHRGFSYAVRPVESERPRFVTCCSQVFDAEGSGLEFVAYDAHEVEVQRDNPFLSRTEMFRVMTRSLDLYRRRHAGALNA